MYLQVYGKISTCPESKPFEQWRRIHHEDHYDGRSSANIDTLTRQIDSSRKHIGKNPHMDSVIVEITQDGPGKTF